MGPTALLVARELGCVRSTVETGLGECVKLASAIRRAAAGCVTPSTGADEDNLSYMQLDKVAQAVSRETFGPLYLVT